MKKHYLLLVLLVFYSLVAIAQLEVKPDSFKEVVGFVNINTDPNYQTDDNDKPFSVLKIKTENIDDKQRHELIFEGDAQTYFVTEYKVGEVWLYISYYATFLKISHPDLSSTEFWFPFDMKPKKGYEITLINKKSDVAGHGSLTIKTKPENGAIIILNGKVLNQKTPFTNDMIAAGQYEITVSKDRYKHVKRNVTIKNGETQIVEIEMPLDVAMITLNADDMTDVYVDGTLKKRGTWSGELSSGNHEITYKKHNYRDANMTIVVEPAKSAIYTIDPKPIYGEIGVSSTPSGAKIFVDDSYKGITPMVVTDVIIGQHSVTIEKDGYNAVTKELTIFEQQRATVNVTMTIGKDITVETGNSGDKIYIDGKFAGYSPLKKALSYGKHKISAYNGNKSAYKEIQVEQYGGTDRVVLTMQRETPASYASTGFKFLTLNASINQYSDLSYGLTIGMMRKYGWFVSATTNFNFDTNADYECDANHFITIDDDLYYPEYTGVESYGSLSVMGGLLMRLGGATAFRIGVGYGIRTQRYETDNGYWVKDSSISANGVDVSLGLQWNFRGFVISIDGVTTGFKTFEAKIGLGYGHKNK